VTVGAVTALTELDVRRALDAVIDPELDEPITDLGFVRSVSVADDRVEVHLRLPTSFCSPNFAYLMASDAQDALAGFAALARDVVVELDDHHDSDLINRGLAANAGYRGTFGHEAELSLDELRQTFRRKAHTASMERALTALARAVPAWTEAQAYRVRLGDLPDGPQKQSLLARRSALGFGVAKDDHVLVDDAGRPVPGEESTARLRWARSVRVSVDGNAHFCRGLLTTRYPGAEKDQTARAVDAGSDDVVTPRPTDGGARRTLLTVLPAERNRS
jgi:metal-sulfur cluster biosynthetic enzyme